MSVLVVGYTRNCTPRCACCKILSFGLQKQNSQPLHIAVKRISYTQNSEYFNPLIKFKFGFTWSRQMMSNNSFVGFKSIREHTQGLSPALPAPSCFNPLPSDIPPGTEKDDKKCRQARQVLSPWIQHN